MLEDLACEFNIATKDVVRKIESLLESGRLTGITDDRGKFIHVTREEFQGVAEYIRGKGRVSKSDLLQNSNRIVRMEPTAEAKREIEAEKQAMLAKVQENLANKN